MVMLITTSAAGQPLPPACAMSGTAFWRTRAAAGFAAALPTTAAPDEVAEADGLGDGLAAGGLGEGVGDGLDANRLSEPAAGGRLIRGAWLETEAVVAADRVELAPPTAQASRPSTARPAASAKSLRRQ